MEKKLTDILYSFSLLLFITAFGFQHNPPSGWYQQFMPNLPNMGITDIFFLDSLKGWAVTGNNEPNDSSGYILRTINGGDNWNLKFSDFRDFSRVKFLNENTGFVSGGYGNGARIYKSIDGGENWFPIGIPGGGQIYFSDMSVLNEDTIWIASPNTLVGGVFRTTNGGINWQLQYSAGSNNPQKIYMHDANLGFISTGVTNSGLRRTTDGGVTWTEIPGVGGFLDLKFIDESTGWKALTETGKIRKTTNGGSNWFDQYLPPQSSFFAYSVIGKLAVINKDTLWGGFPFANFNNQYLKGILYISTDGGEIWNYQVPELKTMGNVSSYRHLFFINKDIGWAYSQSNKGVHTVTGGDSTFIASIQQISTQTPEEYDLYQNYPNPFNPVTKIKFDIPRAGEVKLIVYDMLGKEISILVNEKLSTGSYEYSFDASGLSSGVYFYSLINEKIKITKKMLLLR